MRVISQKTTRPDGKPVYLTIRVPADHQGLVFVKPGNGGTSTSDHNHALASAYWGAKYVTVLVDEVDPSDSNDVPVEVQLPEDEDAIEAASLALADSHTASLRAAVDHVVATFGYQGRIALAGHSVGARSALALATLLGAEKVEHVTVVAPWWVDAFVGDAKSIATRVNVAVGEQDDASRGGAKMLHKRLNSSAQGALAVIPSADHSFHGQESALYDFVSDAVSHHAETARVRIPEE